MNATSQSKQERAYRWIRQRIESGRYGPGSRLVIDAIAKDLEISQVPIREAIRKLEAEGWVKYHRNSGPEVADVTIEQWRATMEVLAVLEGYATALAATHLRPDDIRRLRHLNATMKADLEALDLYAMSAGNRELHRVIYARCPNETLVDMIAETQAKIDAIMGTLFPQIPMRGLASIGEHAKLIELLERKAPFAEIEAMARKHKVNFLSTAVEKLSSQARETAGRAK